MAFDYDVKSIDMELEKYLPKVEGLQKKVYMAMREAIAAGGKRIRPRVIRFLRLKNRILTKYYLIWRL